MREWKYTLSIDILAGGVNCVKDRLGNTVKVYLGKTENRRLSGFYHENSNVRNHERKKGFVVWLYYEQHSILRLSPSGDWEGELLAV